MTRTHTVRTRPDRPRELDPSRRQSLGVPLSVWLSEPLSGCCPTCHEPTACAQRLPMELVRRVVEAFSRPGEVVFAPDAGNGHLLVAPARCGRKVLGLVRGSDHARHTQQQLGDENAEVASLAIVRNAPVPGAVASSVQRIAGRAALAIAAPHTPATSTDLSALTESCAQALRPDGVLVVATRQQPGQDRAGQLTVHAQAAGLVYLQHIVAVEATATDGHLTPPTTGADQDPSHGPHCRCHPTPAGAGRHALVHNDLLVFTKP